MHVVPCEARNVDGKPRLAQDLARQPGPQNRWLIRLMGDHGWAAVVAGTVVGCLASVGGCLGVLIGCVSVPLAWEAGSWAVLRVKPGQVLGPLPVHSAVTSAMPKVLASTQSVLGLLKLQKTPAYTKNATTGGTLLGRCGCTSGRAVKPGGGGE